MEERIDPVVDDIRTETLEEFWKDMNARINKVVSVFRGQIEQGNIEVKLLEYFSYNVY